MPKKRITRGVKYSEKDERERSILKNRSIIADRYWISCSSQYSVNLWQWQNKEHGTFNAENFLKVAYDIEDVVDDNGQLLYPSISRIEPEPLYDIVWQTNTDMNPAYHPRRLSKNRPASKIEVLKVQEYLRKWFFDINYVIEDKDYPGLLAIGTRYLPDITEIKGAYTLYLCGICLECMSCIKEDLKSHLKIKHQSDPVIPTASAEELQTSRPKPHRKQKLHVTRSSVPLEIPVFQPVEKIKIKVKRKTGPKRDYMDSTLKKRLKQSNLPRQRNNETSTTVIEIPCSSASDDTRKLEEVIEEFSSLVPDDSPRMVQTWDERVDTLNESWGKMRPQIGEDIGKIRKAPCEELLCNLCESSAKRVATLHCVTCSYFLCKQCDVQSHIRMPFHQREHWLVGSYQVLMPQQTVHNNEIEAFDSFLPMSTTSIECKNCNMIGKWDMSGKACQKIITVNLQGRYDLKLEALKCHQCSKTHTYTFLDFYISGYFPGSVSRVASVFSLDLLNFCLELQYNSPGLTLNSIVKSLEGVSKFKACNINKSTLSKALEEYSYLSHDLAQLTGEDGLTCPACSPKMHSIMIDGNMKLKRLKSVNKGERQSYYGSELFIPDEVVNRHVVLSTSRTSNTDKAKDGVCGESHWKAAKERSKKMARLDETGVFGATCRHVVPLKLLNMYQGEVYAYPHCLHSYFVNNDVQFQYLWYDVICQYWKYCERMDSATGDQLTAVSKPALPLMHAKGHSATCQILWGGDWKDGAGTTSGEEMEQFWSFLSNSCKPTKYMSSARREETIAMLAAFWGRNKIRSMPEYLKKRYIKVRKLLQEAEKELVKQKGPDFDEMKEDIMNHARELSSGSKVSPEVEYFQLRKAQDVWEALSRGQPDPISRIVTGTVELYQTLQKNQEDRETRLSNLKKHLGDRCLEEGLLSTAMSIVEKQRNLIEVHVHTYNIRVEKFTSLAETSKDRARLRKANLSTKKHIEKALELYNMAAQELDNVEYPQVGAEAVPALLNAQFPWKSNITFGQKRELINKKEAVDRLREEEALLKEEMTQFLFFYEKKLRTKHTTEEISNSQSYLEGMKKTDFFVREREQFYKEQLQKGLKCFSDIADISTERFISDYSDSDSDFSENDLDYL